VVQDDVSGAGGDRRMGKRGRLLRAVVVARPRKKVQQNSTYSNEEKLKGSPEGHQVKNYRTRQRWHFSKIEIQKKRCEKLQFTTTTVHHLLLLVFSGAA
jgi:hypothetical protein